MEPLENMEPGGDGLVITGMDPRVKPVDDDPNIYVKWIPWPGYTDNGLIGVDTRIGAILPLRGGWPIRIPPELAGIPQPFVGTCSPPGRNNAGCASWGNCSYRRYWRQMLHRSQAPWNAIMVVPEGKVDYTFECFRIYTPMTAKKEVIVPGALELGYKFVTNRIKIREDIVGERGRVVGTQMVPVPNLGPMYAHLTGEDWEGTRKGTDGADSQGRRQAARHGVSPGRDDESGVEGLRGLPRNRKRRSSTPRNGRQGEGSQGAVRGGTPTEMGQRPPLHSRPAPGHPASGFEPDDVGRGASTRSWSLLDPRTLAALERREREAFGEVQGDLPER